MHDTLGQALSDFDAALREFREALAFDPPLLDSVFADTSGWANLLTYKLVPHLAGEGCLIAAVAGGTNSGKSTVFNTLLGAAISPVAPTAAATRHPVIAAHPEPRGPLRKNQTTTNDSMRIPIEAPQTPRLSALSKAF